MLEKKLNHFNNIPIMVHSIDKDGVLLYVNNLWLNTLQYKIEEVLGKPSVNFLSARSRKFAKEVILPCFYENGEIMDSPYEFIKKNGEKILVLLSAKAIYDENKNYSHSVAFLSNVTKLCTINGIQGLSYDYWLDDPISYKVKLLKLRNLHKLNQEEMAKKLGVSMRTYQRIESGQNQLDINQVYHLSKIFNFSPFSFFLDAEFDKSPRSKGKVLVVDDEEEIVDFTKDELEERGYQVVTAKDGLEALKRLKEQAFDFVITDIRMPKMDGFKLIEEIKNQFSNHEPTIIISSGSDRESLEEKYGIPQTHVFDKPMDYQRLEDLLNNNP